MRNQKGMTITELVVVLVIIVSLTAGSIPLFFKIRAHSRYKELNQIVDNIKLGVAVWKHKNLIRNRTNTYPLSLDSNDFNQPCTKCFDTILPKAIDNPLLFKSTMTEYYYSINGNTGCSSFYVEKGDYRLIYNPQNGEVRVEEI